MSFILDALRKSEERRRMGESPTLESAPTGRGGRRYRPGRSRLALFALGSCTLVVLVAGSWATRDLLVGQWAQLTGAADLDLPVPANRPLLAEQVGQAPVPDRMMAERGDVGTDSRVPRPAARPSPDQAPSAATGETIDSALPRERVIADPEQIEAELARRMAGETQPGRDEPSRAGQETRPSREAPTPVSEVAAIERQVAEAEARRAERERDQRAAEQQRAEELERSLAVATVPPVAAEAAAPERWSPSASAAEYVRAWELPLSIRRSMPELRLTIHVYSADESQRFVLVNGERFVVGDRLADGARLVDIRREGAVVDFRDYRFLLEP
ncbi:MAG: hypothetical protein EA418_07260 [Wenzhouxiangellaceae bacterium]|nr:MAG: hypothetical protein EA418_07260 [Wenzhouxiangellaceae bacterium]